MEDISLALIALKDLYQERNKVVDTCSRWQDYFLSTVR